MRWVTVVLRVLLALAFAAAAAVKLSDVNEAATLFANLGFPLWAFYAVVAVELGGAIGLLIDKTVEIAAGVLIILMLGAVFTHYHQEKSLLGATPAISLLLLLGVLVHFRRRQRSLVSL
jgi:putative oxidoreductase